MIVDREDRPLEAEPDTPLRREVLQRWVEQALPHGRLDVEVETQIPSTNAELLARSRQQQPPAPLLLAADQQTAGRGRQGRRWHAHRGNALLFSLAVPLGRLPPALPAVTLAGGVALARVLEARGVRVRLKWPNDLLLDGRKLGGLLFEIATDAAGRATLIAGVGLNVRLSEDDRAAIGQPAAALAEVAGVDVGRERWIAALSAALLDAVGAYVERGFAPWREPYNGLLAGVDAHADIVEDGRVVAQGRIVEVDDTGRLLLQSGGARLAVSVGDVSLRVGVREAAQ